MIITPRTMPSCVLNALLIVVAIVVFGVCLVFTRVVALDVSFFMAFEAVKLGYILAVASWATGITLVLQPVRLGYRIMFLMGLLAVLAALNAIDLTFLYYFDQPTIVLYPYFPRPEVGIASLFAYITYLRHYMLPSFYIYSFLVLIPVVVVFYLIGSRLASLRIPAAFAAIAGLAMLCAPFHFGSSIEAREPFAGRLLRIDPNIPRKHLYAVKRSRSLALFEAPRYKPRTIVLVVNENTSYFNKSSDDSRTSLIDRIIASSGGKSSWNIYHNAVTNSNCTDVSLPSLLTGSGAHEGFDKLHDLPFVFDIAKARGYRTAFYTSAFMEWAKLSVFLANANIDSGLTASQTGLPLINDLAVDDIPVMRRLQDFIRTVPTEEPLFIVTYLQGMHTPYQGESELDFPTGLRDRRSRALYVIETAHRMLFDALRDTDRLSDAFIIVTADHGEPMTGETKLIPRIEHYGEETLRVPLLIKEPASLPTDLAAGLRANVAGLVSNLDIAPTIAGLLGVGLQEGLTYTGYSLLQKVPADRLSVAASVTEWRPWPRAAVALARGADRFTCRHGGLCRYHSSSAEEEAAMTAEVRAAKFLQYMNEALRLPVVAQSISRIYHAHWGVTWSSPGGAVRGRQ